MIMTLYKFIEKKYALENTLPSIRKNNHHLSENYKDTGQFHSKRSVKKSSADRYDNMEIRKQMNNMEVSICSVMMKLDAICKRLDKLDHVLQYKH